MTTDHHLRGGSTISRAALDAVTAAAPRQPAWSGRLTHPLAAHIPAGPGTLRAIKLIHSAAFAAIAASVVVVAWDGVRASPRRRTAVAAAIALGETAVYLSNNQVCPLTPLAEELGATSGTVTDLYLPRSISDRIPLIAGTALVAGLALNGVALARRRPSAGNDDDLARRPADDLRRDAPQDQAPQVRPRPRSEHDDVGLFGGRRFDDRLGGVAFPDEEHRGHACVAGLPHDDLGSRGEPVPLLVDAPRQAARQPETVRLDNADHEEVGALGGGPADRFLGGAAR